jgi:hypothetical protein
MKVLRNMMCVASRIGTWNIQNVFEVSLLEPDWSGAVYETHTKDRIGALHSSIFDIESLT